MNKTVHHVRVAPVKAISLKALLRQSLESIGSANAPIGGRVHWAELRRARFLVASSEVPGLLASSNATDALR